MRVRAKQLIGQLLVAETGTKNVVWDDARYYWTHLRELERAAKALGFTTVREQPDFAVYITSEDLVIKTVWGFLVVRFGAQIDKAKFDRELARLGAVAESCKKADGWDCDCYYWTPRDKLEQAAKALGFTSERSYHCFPPTRATPEDLVINNFAGGVVVKQGKQMDQAKFDRALSRVTSVSESQGKKTWPAQRFTNDYWSVDPQVVLKAAADQGFTGRLLGIDEEPSQLPGYLLLVVRYSKLIDIPGGALIDREKFDREITRLSSVRESAKKVWSRAGSHADYWRVPAETVVKVAKNLGFEARLVPASATGHSPVNLMLASFNGPVIIANGRKMDREKFDRELAKLSAVSESKEQWSQPGNWFALSNDNYWNADPRVLIAAAKSLGFSATKQVSSWEVPMVDADDLVLLNAARAVIVTGGASMDRDKFDRELARLSVVSESTTDYGFPKTGTWEVLPKTIRLYPNADALKVHAALKSMGITPIRPDSIKGTPSRIIELTYYSMGIPDDVVFDFARFARELARARSSSE